MEVAQFAMRSIHTCKFDSAKFCQSRALRKIEGRWTHKNILHQKFVNILGFVGGLGTHCICKPCLPFFQLNLTR